MSSLHQTDLPCLRCEWLWVYDSLVPTTETWSKEIIVPAGLFFVIKGHGRIQADGHEFDLPPGRAFFSAPGMRRQWFAQGTRLLSVGFRVTWPDGLPLLSEGLNCAHATLRLNALHSATRHLYRTVHGARRTVTHREASGAPVPGFTSWCQREAAFRTWFAVYAETLAKLDIHPAPVRCPGDERLNEVIRRLDSWPLAKPLEIAGLAAGLDFGSRRLEQLLVAESGLTPHAHLNRRRIDTARRLLASTTTPLKQIAHQLGLRHASHFTKWFRRHAGMAPSVYREGGGNEAV